ncbi:GNAT family N-acetyltransferase [Streptomyces sp. NPDC059980]|uniref:GNAT family N-acetyltransferase n=1 Tax=Streptomyces sp. NPDC059980 TaxID=3347022 RepID=UPI00368DF33A
MISPNPSGGAVLRPLDVLRTDDVNSVITLFGHYLSEEFERTKEWPDGTPVGATLFTTVMEVEGDVIGFASVDVALNAVELVYVAPAYRRRGIASAVLGEWRRQCPRALCAKAPVSPTGRRLMDSLGIPEAPRSAEDLTEIERAHTEAYAYVAAQCGHKRGHPGRPCKRCCQKHLERASVSAVMMYVNAVRAGKLALT